VKGEPQSCVTLFAIVGLLEVLQQTPLFTISAPPLEIIVPPLTEDKAVILPTAVVVKVGKTACWEAFNRIIPHCLIHLMMGVCCSFTFDLK
jgi:hypothetical protein